MFPSVLISAFSAASSAGEHRERHVVAMAPCRPLWVGGKFCRSTRKVFALEGFILCLSKQDIRTHREDEITKQEVNDNRKQ